MAKKINNGNFPVNVNFNLRATKPANKDTAVNAVVRFNNQRIVLSGITKAQPRFWNEGAPTQHVANVDAKKIKKKLNDAESKIIEIFDEYTNKHNAFPSDLKAFQELLRKKVFNIPDKPREDHTHNKSVCNYLTRFIEEAKAGTRTKAKDVPFVWNTIKGYGTLLTHLSAFRGNVTFDEVTLDFYYDFKEYIYGKNHAPNYFGSLIKRLKTIMATAQDEGYHNNTVYKHRKFEKIAIDSEDAVFLDETKLDKLFALDLSGKAYLSNARDLFLIGCYTGLRFSDFSQLDASMVDGDFIRIKTQKTGERVTIPINVNLRTILGRYGNGAPHAISNQKLNEYIKEIGKLAKFTDPCDSVEYKAGKKVVKQAPFHSLMTTHTARRSFASNAFKAGIPVLLIMAITGHKTEKAFLTYIRQSADDKAKMFKAWMDRVDADKARKTLKVVGGGE